MHMMFQATKLHRNCACKNKLQPTWQAAVSESWKQTTENPVKAVLLYTVPGQCVTWPHVAGLLTIAIVINAILVAIGCGSPSSCCFSRVHPQVPNQVRVGEVHASVNYAHPDLGGSCEAICPCCGCSDVRHVPLLSQECVIWRCGTGVS